MTDNKNLEKNKAKNASYMQIIKLSDKILPVCTMAIVITAIFAVINLISVLINLDYLTYVYGDFSLFQLFLMLIGELFVYGVLIVIEVCLYRIASLLNKLASSIFRYDSNE